MSDWEKKKCKCVYDKQGKRRGFCLRCFEMRLESFDEGREEERQKMAKALRIEKIKIFSFICPECRHYGEEGKYCPNDRRKLVRESFEYYINSRDEEFNQKLDSYLKKQEGE